MPQTAQEKLVHARLAKIFGGKVFGDWVGKSDDTTVHLSIHRGGGSPDKWGVIPIGAGKEGNSQFGLPSVTMTRANALKFKNENKFDSVPHGYEGQTTLGEFKKTLSLPEQKKAVAESAKRRNEKIPETEENFDKWKGTSRESQIDQTTPENLERIINKIERGEMGDIFKRELPYLKYRLKNKHKEKHESPKEESSQQTPARVLGKQLQVSRVNGFPFFAYTGIKPTIISDTDIHLKPPRNAGNVKAINVHYNEGSDEYDVTYEVGNKTEKINGVGVENLAESIARHMKVL